MPKLSPQLYQFEGERLGISPDTLEKAVQVLGRIQAMDPRLPVIFTLRHLSLMSDTPFIYLRSVVGRGGGEYKQFRLRKKVPGRSLYRVIHVPEDRLLKVQKWISKNILNFTVPSKESFAFHSGSQPLFAAQKHCGCKWLLKVDIEDFFHSVSERKVYSVFRELGYTRLLSFELARITTVVLHSDEKNDRAVVDQYKEIPSYKNTAEGVLPQGAPTSPMISNLVMRGVDTELSDLARHAGFVFTRYADDLVFSTGAKLSFKDVNDFKGLVCSALSRNGFNINRRKTSIRGPGARKVVLGMLVDGKSPRLMKEYKDMLRLHLYYLSSAAHGPSKHAESQNTSISTLYHHIRGKIAWAQKVEPEFGRNCLLKFSSVKWPPFDIYR